MSSGRVGHALRCLAPPGSVARVALFVAPPFGLLIAYLTLHRLGWVERHWRIAFERTLILNLLLYWLLVTLLVCAFLRRRALREALGRQRGSIVLMLVSLLLAAAFAETALRILSLPEPARPFRTIASRRYHHRNIPSWAGEVQTNDDGFRSRRGREEFRAFRHRVALLGDSFVFGLGVAGEQAAGAVLERALGEVVGAGEVAVLNTGVISYSPFIQRLVLRDVVRDYAPTLTLLVLDVNDIGDDLEYARRNVGDERNPRFDVPEKPLRRTLCDRLVLCRMSRPLFHRLGTPIRIVRSLIESRYDYYSFSLDIGGVTESNRFFVLRHPLSETRPYFERTLGYVREIAAEARTAGSAFVLYVAPRYFHWNDAECPDNWELGDRYGVDEPYELEYLRFFDEVKDEVDFPVVSLLPAFKVSSGFPLVFAHDPHWNAAGHRLVGEAIARHLSDLGLIKPQSEAAE